MGLSTEGRFGADGVKLAEEWRGGITIAVEQDIFEESSHEMQVVQAEPRSVGFLDQDQDDLPKIIPNKAVIRVP